MPSIVAHKADKLPFAKRQLKREVEFDGGLNDKVAPELIDDKEVAAIQNFNMLEKGTLQKRHGFTKRFASTFATGPVRGLVNYRKENGTSRLVFGADDKLFYDQPNFSKLYDAQADFEVSGVLRDGITTTETPGDIKPVLGSASAIGTIIAGARRAQAGGNKTYREKVWRTDTIDLTGIGDPTTGRIVSTKTTPSGTTAVFETRSSADGVTWGGWNALGVGDTITSPGTNRKLQVRTRFNSTSGLRASAQLINVLFDQTTSATTLASGFSTIARWDFTTMNDTLWIVNGEVAKKWDGTAFADAGGTPPLGKFIINHKNRLFITGVASNPSRIYFSDVGAPETWNALSFIDVGKGDGDSNTGFFVGINDRLTITKQNSVWELAGDASSNFLLRKVTDEGGCAVKQGGVLMRDTLAWLGKDGVRLFDGVRSALGSDKIPMTFAGLNKRQLAQAATVWWASEQHCFLAVPEGTSLTNNIVLVFDAARTAWTVYRGIPAGEWCIFRQFNADSLVFGDATKGQIYTMDTTGFSDDGAAIDAYVVTKAQPLAGGIEAPSLVPDVFVGCQEPGSQSTTTAISFFKDKGAETATITLTLKAQALNVLRAIPSVVGVSLPRTLAIKVRHNEAGKGFKLSAIDVRYSPKTLRAT
jgi:hypothetical protein